MIVQKALVKSWAALATQRHLAIKVNMQNSDLFLPQTSK